MYVAAAQKGDSQISTPTWWVQLSLLKDRQRVRSPSRETYSSLLLLPPPGRGDHPEDRAGQEAAELRPAGLQGKKRGIKNAQNCCRRDGTHAGVPLHLWRYCSLDVRQMGIFYPIHLENIQTPPYTEVNSSRGWSTWFENPGTPANTRIFRGAGRRQQSSRCSVVFVLCFV